MHKNRAVFDLLIQQEQVDVNITDKDGHSILELALFEANDLEMASELIDHGSDINVKDSNG